MPRAKFSQSFDSGGDTELQFLLQKELKPSDVGSLGRIILPKVAKCVDIHHQR
jgi:hypothetical protein